MSLYRHAAAAAVALATVAFAGGSDAATLEAQYLFGNTLTSSIAGAPALTAVDPAGTSGFTTDTVYGGSRTVYHFNGTNFPTSNQGGLVFDNSGGLLSSNSYSIGMVLKFDDRDGAWRRLVDVQNRQSDNGFYVNPANDLEVYPVFGGGSAFTTGAYHNVILTVDSSDNVDAYLDGVFAFSVNTPIMDIANADNPANVVNLFLDNVVAGGQGEWSAGSIAVANFWNGPLTAAEVSGFVDDPFAGPTPPPVGVPEPATIGLLGGLLAGFGLLRRRKG
jgi:hypothetical protein